MPSDKMDTPRVRWQEYPFPLRPNFTARLTLPTDLTADEVRRITAMLETLVLKDANGQE